MMGTIIDGEGRCTEGQGIDRRGMTMVDKYGDSPGCEHGRYSPVQHISLAAGCGIDSTHLLWTEIELLHMSLSTTRIYIFSHGHV